MNRMQGCAMCGDPILDTEQLCSACSRDIEWRDKYEYAVDNQPTCATCGSNLSTSGRCLEGHGRWTPAQVLAVAS